MERQDKRELQRNGIAEWQFPIRCRLRTSSGEVSAEVINYHFQGACLKLSAKDIPKLLDTPAQQLKLDFYVGQRCLKSEHPYKICWNDFQHSGAFGVEFLQSLKPWVEREARLPMHHKIKPTLSAPDPTDPNRDIYFDVINVSLGGCLLSTSLTNRHLFPGMSMKNALLSVPGKSTESCHLQIENTKLSPDKTSMELGVSFKTPSPALLENLRHYLSTMVNKKDAKIDWDEFSKSALYTKKIKSGLSFRSINNEADYESVLKLRFRGYKKHGKVVEGKHWRDMGEGLTNEGLIIGAFLGGELVSCIEIRFGSDNIAFRYVTEEHMARLGLHRNRIAEGNKLVVHPSIQGSDIVLGMIQKIHAILVAKGGLDFVMASTDKLVPLYKRLGADNSGLKIPHPTLPDQPLNIMIVRHEVYLGQDRFNPYAWESVYGAIHDAYASVGMVEKTSFSTKQKIEKFITPYLLKFKSKNKKTESSGKTIGEKTGFIDPRWTSQHMLSSVLHPYIQFADQKIGPENVDKILSEINIPRSHIRKQSNWLSTQFLDAFIEKYKAYGDVKELSREAGLISLGKNIIGLNYYLLKHFVTPELAFRQFEKIMPSFNRSRSYKLHECSHGKARISVGKKTGYDLPAHSESCENWKASFEAYILLMTGKKGHVAKTQCCYKGDESCTYEIYWAHHPKKYLEPVLSGIAALVSALSYYPTSRAFGHTTALSISIATLPFLALCYYYYISRQQRKNINEINEEFERFQNETNEKYSDLQNAKEQLDHRYREAILLDKTSKEIQQSNDVTSILKISLDAVCTNFGFDRAFAMLCEENKNTLRTSAVSGIHEGVASIWQYQVDVSQDKKNPLLLSSVFRTGSPVMITNVEEHLFQLNESSQKLIAQLKTNGFIIVAIPSHQGSWGVIIGDKLSKTNPVNRTDLVLLQRIAQHIGLALDKHFKLEQEQRLRRYFQKYVPVQVLDESLSLGGPSLEGATKEIACLFLDIRGFTNLTAQFPEHITIHVLNKLFSHINGIVTKHSGVIDKFLGDGALITWGSLTQSADTPERAVSAAVEILATLPKINEDLVNSGIPELKIGMGIHYGPAIVGNIGSEDRLEHTCIGATVNLASRLENLTKEHDCSLIISNELWQKLPNKQQQQFSQNYSQKIRGMDSLVGIRVLNTKNDTQIKKAA